MCRKAAGLIRISPMIKRRQFIYDTPVKVAVRDMNIYAKQYENHPKTQPEVAKGYHGKSNGNIPS